MVPTSPRLPQGFKLTVLVLLLSIVTLFYVFQTHSSTIIYHYHRYKFGDKELYVEAALSNSIDSQFDAASLRAQCAHTTWIPGIIFDCKSPSGDIAEIGNAVLNCARFAIEGGGALVVPNLVLRDWTTSKEEFVEKEFSHLFNTEHFMNSLNAACPQMRVYSHINDLYDLPSTSPATKLAPESLAEHKSHPSLITNMTAWRPSFESFLKSSCPPYSSKHPIRIDLQLPNRPFIFPISHDPGSLTLNFGHLVFAQTTIRRLAASVLFTMSEKFQWHLQPNDGIIAHAFAGFLLPPTSRQQNQDQKGKEKSDLQMEMLAMRYINQTRAVGLQVAYLSGDNADFSHRFLSLASQHNITVVTASSLLSSNDLDVLQRLTPEQQALVGYEVLLVSSAFGGTESRVEAWKIGLRRHKLSAKTDFLGDPPGDGWVLGDEWSVVWSEEGDRVKGWRGQLVRGLWP